MIIVDLMGGLGNQLFQWALGVGLQSRGRQVSYDSSRLGPDKHRKFELAFLGVNPVSSYCARTVYEPSLCFHSEVFEQDHVRLSGYWQSEKYFANVDRGIRAKFHAAYSSTLLPAIQAEPNSVFLHIRRTDYLAESSLKFHGLLNLNYYGAAMNAVKARVPDAKFFVFSDDPEWCRNQFFSGDYITVVDSSSPQEDMLLMSYCRHGILANSSFSWWGSWLNPLESDKPYDRIVIAPRQWFAAEHMQAQSQDIVPERWMRI